MAKHTMTVLADGSERVAYNDPAYPVYAGFGRLGRLPGMKVIHHWHEDMEFIYCRTGHMVYSVNGEHVRLREGDGIYVSPRQVHRNYSEDGTDASYLTVLIHPSLLRTRFQEMEQIISDMLRGDGCPYLLLRPEVEWQKQMIDEIRRIHVLIRRPEESRMIGVMGCAFEMTFLLHENMPQETESARPDRRIPTLRDMVNFIQKHYAEKVSIADICKAGKVGSSTCYDLFKKHLDTTPLGYLTLYRLEKSLELLASPGLSITEVAYATGFSGASYYAESFRKQYQLSPTEYRTRIQAELREGNEAKG